MDPPPKIPNVDFLGISKDAVREQYAHCAKFLPPTVNFDKDTFSLPRGEGEADYTAAYSREGDIIWEKMGKIATISQDDPLWVENAKNIPMMLSASTLYKYLLMSHGESAKRLDLSPGMIVTSQTDKQDPAWEEFYYKMLNPRFPGKPFDTMSHTFMRWGTTHENSVLTTFLHRFSSQYRYEDRGLTFLTPELLRKGNFVNYLQNSAQITSLPFLLAASPDGLLRDVISGEVMNCEWKAPTGYRPDDNTDFPGVEFFPIKGKKPYDKPKTYYIPQMMLQMLVCGTKKCMFGSWALTKGMNLWVIDFNSEYVSLMLTLLIHIYNTFIAPSVAADKRGKVPIGYFQDIDTPTAIVNCYARLEALTLKIVATKMFHFIPGEVCQEVTKKVLGLPADYVVPPYIPTLYFPDVRHPLPAYLLLGVLAKYFLGEGAAKIESPHDVGKRLGNMVGLTRSSPLFVFTRVVIASILKNGLKYYEGFDNHRWVFQWKLDRAERYLLHVLMIVYRFHAFCKWQLNIKAPEDIEKLQTEYINGLFNNVFMGVLLPLFLKEQIGSQNVNTSLDSKMILMGLSSMLKTDNVHDEEFGLYNCGKHLIAASVGGHAFAPEPAGDDEFMRLLAGKLEIKVDEAPRRNELALLVAMERIMPLVTRALSAKEVNERIRYQYKTLEGGMRHRYGPASSSSTSNPDE